MNSASKPETARVFFALWPDQCCASRLSTVATHFAARLGGRAMPEDTLHLTLAFVGNVDLRRLPELLAIGNEISHAPSSPAPDLAPGGAHHAGRIPIDLLDYWESPGILYATSQHLPPALVALAAQLLAGLNSRGYSIAPRPFVAHVTLVRNLKTPPQAGDLDLLKRIPIPWTSHHFVLMRSRPGPLGPAYERLADWNLDDR